MGVAAGACDSRAVFLIRNRVAAASSGAAFISSNVPDCLRALEVKPRSPVVFQSLS